MKIAYINVTYQNASTGKIIRDITSGLPENIFSWRVLFQVGGNADENAFQFEKPWEFQLRRGAHKLFGNRKAVTESQTRRLIGELERFQPDIVHLHTIHHQCTHYPMLFDFLAQMGKPVVYTLHDCWPYTGGCYHYTQQNCRGFLTGCTDCPKPASQLECRPGETAAELQRKLHFYASCPVYFVGVSQWITGEVQKSLIKPEYITTIPNGIDTAVFAPLSPSQELAKIRQKLTGGKPYCILAVAGYWSEKKGLSVLYRLAEACRDIAQVVLVGEKPENVPADCPVTFYGKTRNAGELAMLYNSADILVNASLEESFGLVTAEAACCGLPVAAFDSTANSETVRLAGGCLVPAGEEDSLTDAVRKTLLQGRKMENLSRVRSLFSKETMAQNYRALYESILQEEGS